MIFFCFVFPPDSLAGDGILQYFGLHRRTQAMVASQLQSRSRLETGALILLHYGWTGKSRNRLLNFRLERIELSFV